MRPPPLHQPISSPEPGAGELVCSAPAAGHHLYLRTLQTSSQHPRAPGLPQNPARDKMGGRGWPAAPGRRFMCWEWGLTSSTESCAHQKRGAVPHSVQPEKPACPSESSGVLRTHPLGFVDTGIWGPRHPKSRDWLFPTLPLSQTRSIKQWGRVPDVTLPGFKSRFTTSETTHPWRWDPASPFLRL